MSRRRLQQGLCTRGCPEDTQGSLCTCVMCEPQESLHQSACTCVCPVNPCVSMYEPHRSNVKTWAHMCKYVPRIHMCVLMDLQVRWCVCACEKQRARERARTGRVKGPGPCTHFHTRSQQGLLGGLAALLGLHPGWRATVPRNHCHPQVSPGSSRPTPTVPKTQSMSKPGILEAKRANPKSHSSPSQPVCPQGQAHSPFPDPSLSPGFIPPLHTTEKL